MTFLISGKMDWIPAASVENGHRNLLLAIAFGCNRAE
jgi:hypothetical protein